MAYKKGYVNFANCKIDLSMKPMIPREETEFWIKKAIKLMTFNVINCLDIFAGSGCIGIAVLKHIKIAKVVFAEIDKNLIKQIKFNLKLNKVSPIRYKIIQSDVFKEFKMGNSRRVKGIQRGSQFDYIFANPPYIALKNKHLVQKSVLDYEPHLALFGGKDGLLYIRKFLKNARKYLKPHGKIYLEFDYLQKNDLENLLKKLNYKNYKIYKDQFKKWRCVCIKN
jgi:release factor glutamine methyltransferase